MGEKSGQRRQRAQRQGAVARQNAAAQKRQTRQAQWEQRRAERERVNAARQRWRQARRWTIYGAGGIVALIIVFLIVRAVRQTHVGPVVITGTGTYTTAASGATRDGMSCLGSEGTVEHIHMYLAIYVDNQQVQVPPNTGIVNGGSCLYPLHVHSDTGDENIIHEESPNNNIYTLGAFFDIWGQRLSRTQVMSYTADASHTLRFVTFDGSGHETTVTGNPLDIKFSEHETIYILYNSPQVTPKPFTKWLPGE